MHSLYNSVYKYRIQITSIWFSILFLNKFYILGSAPLRCHVSWDVITLACQLKMFPHNCSTCFCKNSKYMTVTSSHYIKPTLMRIYSTIQQNYFQIDLSQGVSKQTAIIFLLQFHALIKQNSCLRERNLCTFYKCYTKQEMLKQLYNQQAKKVIFTLFQCISLHLQMC